MESELVDQLAKGYYVLADRKPTVVSAIAAIPKDNGKIRLIHDGSRPVGTGMNDYATPDKVRFQTLEDACRLAKPGFFCAKLDLKSAYRSVAIHPSEYRVTGLKWVFQGESEPRYLFDARLPFGSSCGPSHFHRISQAVRRCMARKGYSDLVAYIDDFLVVGKTYDECNRALHALIKLVRQLGFHISYDKVVGPTQQLTFLGLQINTQRCTLSLGADKLNKLEDQLRQFSTRRRATKRQLQQLAGSLNYACNAVRGGKFFLRRILDVMAPLQQQHHKARLSTEFKKDLAWWLTYLRVFNGTVYYAASQIHVWVDACNVSAGAFCAGDWVYTVYQCDAPAVQDLHINYKEVYAAVRALNVWAPRFRGQTVIIHTDSTATKGIINKGRTKNAYVNAMLRQMFWVCARYDCVVKAVSIAGVINTYADTVSRLHESGKLALLTVLLSNWSHRRLQQPLILCNHMSSKAALFLHSRCGVPTT